MLNVNDKTTIGVVNVFVIFVRSMCCLTIYVACNLNLLENLMINLYFMILKQTFLKGYDVLHEFCEFLFSTEHKGFMAIAHNAKSFDAVLIQRWLIQHRPTANMHVIHSGQKIMQLTLSNYQICLIDSLNFLQMPLSKFLETFSLNLTTHSKGDFPFKFNIFENQNYIGPMPDIEFYATDTKKDKKTCDEFIAWHGNWLKATIFLTFKKKCTRTVHKM